MISKGAPESDRALLLHKDVQDHKPLGKPELRNYP